MRSISSAASLLASLAVTATLTSAFAPSIADACGGGGYGGEMLPAVFAVDDHHVTREGTDQRRAFILFGSGSPSDKATWTRLWPSSFDNTRIADAPDTTRPVTMTLIGPSGTRVVSSTDRTFIADSFRSRQQQVAMEIGIDRKAEFSVAVMGAQRDAKWLGTSDVTSTKQTLAWLKAQGVTTANATVTKIQGTKLRVISAYQDGAPGMTSFVLDGTTTLTTAFGNPIGAIDLGAKRYVLLEQDGVITPVAV